MKFIPPVKIVPTGDKAACQNYIRFAARQHAIMKQLMSFQGLNEGVRRVSPIEGVYVTCVSSFSYNEIAIHVEQPVGARQERLKEKPEEKREVPKEISFNEAMYFIRIKHPDPEPKPRDLDGYDTENDNSALNMDRIILFGLQFGGNIDDIDPSEDMSNRGGGFTPGGGQLFYDVDILNGVVYYPIDAGDQTQSIIDLVKGIAENLPTNAKPFPYNRLEDIAEKYYEYGRMHDPVNASVRGDYAKPDATVSYDISSTYVTPSGVSWYPMTDPVPMASEAEVDGASGAALASWRNEWSPIYGGDTEIYIDMCSFDGITDIKDFYGTYKYIINPPDWVNTTYATDVRLAQDTYGDIVIVHNTDGPLGDGSLDDSPLVDGTFFAPETDPTKPFMDAPLLFCLFTLRRPPANGIDTYFEARVNGVVGGNDFINGEAHCSFADDTYASVSHIITPLEIVDVTEALVYENGPCPENPCLFGLNAGYKWSNVSKDTTFTESDGTVHPIGEWMSSYYPCPLEYNVYYNETESTRRYNVARTENYECDTHRFVTFHIAEISKPALNDQKYFSSLFVFNEARGERKQAACDSGITTGVKDEEVCTCNGVVSTWGEMIPTPFSEIGVLIYIFAPINIYTTNWETGLKEISWDIHTARRDQNIINPYRCLALEEYVNGILSDIEAFISAEPSVDKSAAGAAYTLNYYGFGITDGFTRK